MSTTVDHCHAMNAFMAKPTKDYPTPFAERLDDALLESGKKKSDVYNAIGSNKQAWSAWMNRGSIPEPSTALKLAMELGVNVRWLIDGKGQRKAVKQQFSQDQIDIAEAWPNLPPLLQEQIALLIRHSAADAVPTLRNAMTSGDREDQERANRLLEAAQEKARKDKP